MLAEERVDSFDELRRAAKYDPRLISLNSDLNEFATKVASEAGCAAKSRAAGALECVLANLFTVDKDREEYLGVSRRKNDYNIPERYRPWHYTYVATRRAMDALVKESWVELIPGNQWLQLRSRLRLTDKLRRQFEALDPGLKLKLTPCGEVLRLKDRSGILVDYCETKKLRALRNAVIRYNQFLATNVLSLQKAHGLDPRELRQFELRRDLYRVFNYGGFLDGGRLYGGGWQNISGESRGCILIGGLQTTEIDFSGMHLRMLYDLEACNLQGDPYDFLGAHGLRPFAKQVAVIAINAQGRAKTIGAVRQWLRQNAELGLGQILSGHGLDVVRCYELFESRHQPIAKYFASGVGTRLQKMDSDMAMRIIGHFAEKKILSLPVHDSFIIRSDCADELADVMQENYQRMFPGRHLTPIPLKRSRPREAATACRSVEGPSVAGA